MQSDAAQRGAAVLRGRPYCALFRTAVRFGGLAVLTLLAWMLGAALAQSTSAAATAADSPSASTPVAKRSACKGRSCGQDMRLQTKASLAGGAARFARLMNRMTSSGSPGGAQARDAHMVNERELALIGPRVERALSGTARPSPRGRTGGADTEHRLGATRLAKDTTKAALATGADALRLPRHVDLQGVRTPARALERVARPALSQIQVHGRGALERADAAAAGLLPSERLAAPVVHVSRLAETAESVTTTANVPLTGLPTVDGLPGQHQLQAQTSAVPAVPAFGDLDTVHGIAQTLHPEGVPGDIRDPRSVRSIWSGAEPAARTPVTFRTEAVSSLPGAPAPLAPAGHHTHDDVLPHSGHGAGPGASMSSTVLLTAPAAAGRPMFDQPGLNDAAMSAAPAVVPD
ncbi:hypothetical protein ACFVH6_06985 [Spirillospora sp. NPDC127200]